MEVGRVYKTHMSDGSMVRIAKIHTKVNKLTKEEKITSLDVLYIGQESLGICPLDPSRVIDLQVDPEVWMAHHAVEKVRRAMMKEEREKNEQAKTLRSYTG